MNNELLKEINDLFLTGKIGNPEEVLSGLLIIVAALVLVVAAIVLIFIILDVVGKWKMFEKAGESGWKALIPVYRTYTQCVIIGVSPWWLLVILTCYLISSFLTPFKFVVDIVVIYFFIIIALSTAKSYGKKEGFGIGIFLLSPVFNMILGFDNSKYEGKRPVCDFLGLSIKNQNPTPEVKKTKTSPRTKTKTTKKKTNTKSTSKKTTAKKK